LLAFINKTIINLIVACRGKLNSPTSWSGIIEADDGDVLVMCTVMSAPAIVRTVTKV